ncbi:MAG: DUF928 domain-containing protein [Cyanobacteria bacterium]|nr:DUF928 domain-containing protein [Cyanobacteriota bacterium]MDA0866325.1 DUF928 domain-containing protein [Cyanobacteriota bacterium]
MNLRPYRNALMLSATLALGLWIGEARAATSIHPIQTQFGETGSTIELASRRRFSVGARASRYRVGGFRRGGTCLADGSEVTPLSPPLAAEELDAADDLPVDVTTADRPVFFIHVPELAESTPAQFTLQNEAGTEELANATFQLSGEAGIVGLQPATLSQELVPGDIYYWQMAIQCSADSPDQNPVVSGWITVAEKTEPLDGTVFDQAVTLVEDGIWQDAVLLLAQARLNAPDEAAATVADEDWQAVMDGAGLADFADEPIVGIMQQ